jgi:hypothetical protein
LESVEVVVFEPTEKYQNVAKPAGVAKLTPARALVAEMVRRYWVLGIERTTTGHRGPAGGLARCDGAGHLNSDGLSRRFVPEASAAGYHPVEVRLSWTGEFRIRAAGILIEGRVAMKGTPHSFRAL